MNQSIKLTIFGINYGITHSKTHPHKELEKKDG